MSSNLTWGSIRWRSSVWPEQRSLKPHVGGSNPPASTSMDAIEAAWVGAMIEAEGSIYPNGAGWRLNLASTDVETLATLLRLTGVGTVYVRRLKKEMRKCVILCCNCHRAETLV